LVEARILAPDQLEAVLALQRTDGRKLGQLLVESGLVSETSLTQILSQQLSVPWVSLYHIDFSRELLAQVPRELADRYGLIPIYVRAVRGQGDTLYVAMEDPMNEDALRECAACSGLPTRPMIAAPTEIRRAIRVYYDGSVSAPTLTAAKKIPPAEAHHPEAVAAKNGTRAPTTALIEPPLAAPADTAASFSPVVPVSATTASPQEDGPVLEVHEVDLPRATRRRKRLELTLLDGTTLKLPSGRGAGGGSDDEPSGAEIVAALRAAARGADAGHVLGDNVRWEKMMAVVLDLLLRKHLILERELLDALKKG
jgi:type IV pilus assembly protein PilB